MMTNSPNSMGAKKLVARPVVEYSPKSSPSVPGSAMRAKKVRDEDCAGPTKRARMSAQIQKVMG